MSNVVSFPKAKATLDLTELSFVHDYWVRPPGRKRGQPFRVFWAVSSSGDYPADVEAGQQMAIEWLRVVGGLNIGAVLLGWIVTDMPRKLTGLEVGFLCTIGLVAGTNPYAEQVIRLREEEDKKIAAAWIDNA
jgi:hypothetical protein